MAVQQQEGGRRKSIRRHHNDSPANPANNLTIPVSIADDILEYIFTFLPIKEAINAGLVSTRFKKSWTFNRKLLFDRGFSRALRNDSEAISIINHVIDSHVGSEIKVFRLCLDSTGVDPMILNWIEKLTQKGIEELELEFDRGCRPFLLPIRFFESLDRIKILKLTKCCIHHPPFPVFNGNKFLRFLNTIFFRKVCFGGELIIEVLFSYCSFLESLELVQCTNVRHLRICARHNKFFKVLKVGKCLDIEKIDIDASSLTTLHYYGNLHGFSLEADMDFSKLKDVAFIFQSTRSYPSFKQVEVLANHVKNVEIFTTTSSFLEGLSSKLRNYRDCSFSMLNLKELQLFLDGTSFCNLYDIASFLRNCPCLESLFLQLNEFYFNCGSYWEWHQKTILSSDEHVFRCLKMIKIKGFRFQRHEMEIARYFLEKSVCLETLYLVFPKNGRTSICLGDLPTCKQLFLTWKASPNAKIIVNEHQNDKSPLPKLRNFWY